MDERLSLVGAGRFPGGRYGFLGRRGGCSRGPFATLNLSLRVGDRPQAVRANRRRLRDLLGGAALSWARQVHGSAVLEVEEPGEAGQADALLTRRRGLALLILTADCVPVVVAAPHRGVVGIAHAGWRGTAARVVPALVRRLAELSGARPGELIAAIGPAIGLCCYAVGEDVAERVGAACGGLDPSFWRPAEDGTGRGWIDLRECNRRQLLLAGVAEDRVAVVGPCTACRTDILFSHRASGGRAGRQGSFVMLEE